MKLKVRKVLGRGPASPDRWQDIELGVGDRIIDLHHPRRGPAVIVGLDSDAMTMRVRNAEPGRRGYREYTTISLWRFADTYGRKDGYRLWTDEDIQAERLSLL